VFLMGVTIRHFFNTMHSKKGMPWWTWAATAILFIGIMALSTAPLMQDTYEESEARALTPHEQRYASAEGWSDVQDIVMGRCSLCHAREPVWDGIRRAPKNILLETPADIAHAARQVYIQAGVSHAMPPANITYMEPAERAQSVRWFRAAQG
jgi:uncharacterized membrane protein